MTNWTDVSAAVQTGKVGKASTINAIQDNISAQAEGSVGAPKNSDNSLSVGDYIDQRTNTTLGDLLIAQHTLLSTPSTTQIMAAPDDSTASETYVVVADTIVAQAGSFRLDFKMYYTGDTSSASYKIEAYGAPTITGTVASPTPTTVSNTITMASGGFLKISIKRGTQTGPTSPTAHIEDIAVYADNFAGNLAWDVVIRAGINYSVRSF